MAEQKAGCALDEIPVSEYPAWVLSSKERARTTSITLTTSDVPRIMQEYSGLLEKYPTAYMDEKWLPVPKDQMRLVLKAAWKMAPMPFFTTRKMPLLMLNGQVRSHTCSLKSDSQTALQV